MTNTPPQRPPPPGVVIDCRTLIGGTISFSLHDKPAGGTTIMAAGIAAPKHCWLTLRPHRWGEPSVRRQDYGECYDAGLPNDSFYYVVKKYRCTRCYREKRTKKMMVKP